MALDATDREELAARLYDAHRETEAREPPSATHDIGLDDAYAIQDAVVERRREAGGARRVGFKVGATNPAVRDQQRVDEPVYGQILDDDVQREPVVRATDHVDARFEPELAFRLGSELAPPLGPKAVVAATDVVFPAIEIVSSRVGGSTELVDHVADNGLHAGVVVGGGAADPRALVDGDPAMVPVQVRVNGSFHEAGLGANAMGDPARAVAWLARRRAEAGEHLRAGDVVLTGSLTRIVELDPGDTLACQWGGLGSTNLHLQ